MLFDEIPDLEPVAFCYWLQGAIEIGEITTFTAEQAAIIRQALEKKAIAEHNVFTLQSLILLRTLPPEIAFVHIRRELQQIFIHDIDNSYEGDQQFFHLVHTGKAEVL
jgi:hypothetical protein